MAYAPVYVNNKNGVGRRRRSHGFCLVEKYWTTFIRAMIWNLIQAFSTERY